jgi:hypothetical protein
MCEEMQLAMLARSERRLDREVAGLRAEIDRKQFIIDIDQILIRGLVHLVDDLRAQIEAGAPTRICGYADTQELRALLLQRAWEAPDLSDSMQIIELVDRLESSQEMEHS